ncbi:MAG: M56 family metallopeptidase [Rhodothermales bacterium]
MNAFLEILQHPFVDRVGVALIHFIWQGALVAGLLAIMLRLLKNGSLQVKYTCCSIALLLMFLLPVSTVVQTYLSPRAQQASQQIVLVPSHVSETSTAPAVNEKEKAPAPVITSVKIFDVMSFMLSRWQSAAVVVWLLGLTFFSLKMMAGLWTIHRLRTNSVTLQHEEIETQFIDLLASFDIRKPIRLSVSHQIRQPLLIGWLKPVVLLPVSILTALPIEQVEAILAHELAHVRRHDYLVSLLQSLMEVLFFYHPAVWWVSGKMRVQREFCCDDLATGLLENKVVYVNALANLEASRMSKQSLALSAKGGRLVDRIQFLVERNAGETGKTQPGSSWITPVMLMVVCLFVFVACQDTNSEAPDAFVWSEVMAAAQGGQFAKAMRLSEPAAENGNLCAIMIMAEFSEPENRARMGDPFSILMSSDWFRKKPSESNYWSKIWVESLHKKAEEGSGTAALWLYRVYHTRWHLPFYTDVGKNDSLAYAWLDKAILQGNLEAKYSKGFFMDDKEAALLQFKEAALEGYVPGFRKWASRSKEYDDPRAYFEVSSLAIDRAVPGIHEWLGADLKALSEQAEQGNEQAIEWKAIADSLRLSERLAGLPVTPLVNSYFNGDLCKD